jgi:hypothetical protein
METDDKTPNNRKLGRCYDCGKNILWSRDCTKRDDKKISGNSDSILSFSNSVHDTNFNNFESPVRRLRSRCNEWEKIGSGTCKVVLEVIQVGYKIPFKSDPTSIEVCTE